MADLYSSNVLTGTVNSLQAPPQFLIDTFFPAVQTENSEEIHFDVENDIMGLAPFVSPLVEGKVVEEQGFVTKTLKPAYVKPKTAVDPNRAIKRYMGEQIGGNLSPADRQRLILADLLGAQRKMILNRQEWMAASVLTTGKVTISGDLYKTVELDFGRDAALTSRLARRSSQLSSRRPSVRCMSFLRIRVAHAVRLADDSSRDGRPRATDTC